MTGDKATGGISSDASHIFNDYRKFAFLTEIEPLDDLDFDKPQLTRVRF